MSRGPLRIAPWPASFGLRGEDLGNRQAESAQKIVVGQAVRLAQDKDPVQAAVDGYGLGPGVDDTDRTSASGEPILDLCGYCAGSIVGGKHFHGQIGGSLEETGRGFRWNSVAAHETDIGGSNCVGIMADLEAGFRAGDDAERVPFREYIQAAVDSTDNPAVFESRGCHHD